MIVDKVFVRLLTVTNISAYGNGKVHLRSANLAPDVKFLAITKIGNTPNLR